MKPKGKPQAPVAAKTADDGKAIDPKYTPVAVVCRTKLVDDELERSDKERK